MKGNSLGNWGLMAAMASLFVPPPDSSSQYGLGQQAIGIAVKVEDGNVDILYSAVMEILKQLSVGTRDMRQQQAGVHHPSIFNTTGVVTGSYKHHFQLRSHQERETFDPS